MKREIQDIGKWPQRNPIKLKSTPIPIRQDYISRPLLIAPDKKIFLYTENKLYRVAYQFLVCIAQPIYRPVYVQQYQITKYSLYSAMVLNFSTDDILFVIGRLMKNKQIPKQVQQYIRFHTRYYGGCRLLLQFDSYSLFLDQSVYRVIKKKCPQIFDHLIIKGQIQYKQGGPALAIVQGFQQFQQQNERFRKMQQYQINGDYFQVARPLIDSSITIIQQYDFQRDSQNKLQFNLKPNTNLRTYQQRALRNIFIDGKARSGLVILPCGAGKTLVAVTAIERMKCRSLIICDGDVSVQQWKDQFLKWTTIDSRKIIRITGKVKDKIDDYKAPFIAVTTYSMVTKNRQNQKTPSLITKLQQKGWGACIADQVHKLPADTFQNVLRSFKFCVKLGFTATPYRQDGKIDKLYFMIGPKLYQQNWLDLVNDGALAKPYCVQVRCPMTAIFKEQYQRLNGQQLLHTANPFKYRALKYLIKVHQKRGDKILVFCDRPKVLQYLAGLMGKPFIHGSVKHDLRRQILSAFKRQATQFQTLFISRVGDVAIDLPSASVAIQIGYHFGSRRQEVQRLGRIMRPKDCKSGSYSAFFYSLVSIDTEQEIYAAQRRACLVNLGLDFQVIQDSVLTPQAQAMKVKQEVQFLSYILANHRQGDKFLQKSENIIQKTMKFEDHLGGVYAQINDPFI